MTISTIHKLRVINGVFITLLICILIRNEVKRVVPPEIPVTVCFVNTTTTWKTVYVYKGDASELPYIKVFLQPRDTIHIDCELTPDRYAVVWCDKQNRVLFSAFTMTDNIVQILIRPNKAPVLI